MIKNVLVAVDGSEHSLKAVDYAIDIALKYGCEMYLLHVVTKVEIPKELMEYADVERIEDPPEYLFFKEIGDRILKKAEKTAKEKGVKEVHTVIKKGNPADKITEFARENDIDWVFMGSRGLGGIKGLLLGSVSNKVCHLTDSTCITVK
ncbi:MAG: universal stress protein [Deltaproteobacteria bacterium]|nr:universal stress protein [Deltaproteobacteria bacterium]